MEKSPPGRGTVAQKDHSGPSSRGKRSFDCRSRTSRVNGFPLVKYAFGSLSVDADARSISSAEGSVHLTRKAFDLLLLLLECRSKAVSKDDIHARLWPDSFVAESSLQTLVHEIRDAI